MRHFHKIILLMIISIFTYACRSTLPKKKEEPVVITNDSLEYEITIIDVGFNNYLNTLAEQRGLYSQSYMEARNNAWVITWNNRAMNPSRFDATIYENQINYSRNVDYGYEVNYLLFNYFLFAQRKYKMSLGGGFRTNRIN